MERTILKHLEEVFFDFRFFFSLHRLWRQAAAADAGSTSRLSGGVLSTCGRLSRQLWFFDVWKEHQQPLALFEMKKAAVLFWKTLKNDFCEIIKKGYYAAVPVGLPGFEGRLLRMNLHWLHMPKVDKLKMLIFQILSVLWWVWKI